MSVVDPKDLAAPNPPERIHLWRLGLIWAFTSGIAVLLIVLWLAPHMPPGNLSVEARDQRHINVLLAALGTPVLLAVWIYFAYALRSFRQQSATTQDGPPLTGHAGAQLVWIAATATIVLALFGWGTYELLPSASGAGGGQGPDPLAKPSGARTALQVQVIGQQWAWTFRFPGYGGFETPQLALPAGRVVELHVTSLDVNHSFWAYQLGVKADAIPGSDNVAYVRPRHPGTFEIRCAELCGLWHGHMHNTGVVMTQAGFASWIRRERVANAPAAKTLPPYSPHYFPDPVRRAG